MIIAVTGSDGSGKSTICKKIMECCDKHILKNDITISSVWDDHSDLFSSLDHARSYLTSLNGATRLFFIFHAISRSLDIAIKKRKKIIIIDGYFYKYAISEIARGAPKEVVNLLIKKLPFPDLTLYLDISPEKSALRKETFSTYEQGNAKGHNDKDRFIKFQKKLKPLWNEYEKEFAPWHRISSDLNPDLIVDFIIEKFLIKVA